MSEYDKSPFAVSGPEQVATLANYYEAAGVPFHAWAVVHGVEPVREARMAAEVLAAGARSIYLDIEPHSGFWRGTPADAIAYGRELRRLQPDGRVVLSIDPRPWTLDRIPLREFAAFSNEIAPQQYWRTFNTPPNYERFAEVGHPVPAEGVTPEFLLNVSNSVLGAFGLPLVQVGQGATPDHDEMRRFIDGIYNAGGNYVTIWRYGVTSEDVFQLLQDVPPRRPPPAAAGGIHVVASGDTLGVIAATYGTSVDAILQANGLSDPNYIYVGQELTIPGLARATPASGTPAPASGGSGGRTYTVKDGDTLYGIAGQFGVSADAIVEASGLADPNFLSVGQELRIP
jgi:LysM repeat protein